MESSPGTIVSSEPRSLSFADGFQFGCGLFVAAALAGLLGLLLLAVIGFVMSLLGVGALQDLLGMARPLVSAMAL